MFNSKDFAAHAADRAQQLQHAEAHNAAQAHRAEERVGPVFGPLMARVGDGLIAAGAYLQQQRRDALQPDEHASPVWPLPVRD
jgi:hypothetical protein